MKLYLLLILLLFFYCCNDHIKTKNETIIKNSNFITNYTDCKQDSLINNVIKLEDSESILRNFGDLSKSLNKNDDWDVFIKNNKNTEYLRLIYYPNLSYIRLNEYSYFEVGLIKNNNPPKKYHKSKFPFFYNSSGIKLGITIDQLKKIKGDDFEIDNNGDNKKHIIKYCNSLYVEEYIFENDSLIFFGFGYYPE